MARRTYTPPSTGTCGLAVQRTTCVACGTPLRTAHRADRTIRRLDGIWQLSFAPLARPELFERVFEFALAPDTWVSEIACLYH